MQFRQLLVFVDLLSLVIDKHLEQQSLPFLRDEVVHGLVYFDSVFDGVLGCFDEAGLGLVAGLVFIFFA